MKKTLHVPQGIIFVYDQKHEDIIIPDYDEKSLVSWNNSCISVCTIPDFEGETSINLTGKASDVDTKGLHALFSGLIDTPSKEICVATSGANVCLSVEVSENHTNVSVWSDDPDFPTSLLIQVY